MATKLRREFETLISAAERTELSIRTLAQEDRHRRSHRSPQRVADHPRRPR